MSHVHERPSRAFAGEPTLSLLRLSAAQRAGGALAIVALLWTCVVALIGRGA
jgi:hypothetical protein